MTEPLIDSHCHLDFDSFESDFDAILERARHAGVVHIVTIGSGDGMDSAHGALRVARMHNWISPTVGLHPHDAKLISQETRDALEKLAALPEVVAIGETGLDHHYEHSPKDKQDEAFRAQIALAKKVKKPLVIHTRSAPTETLAILREENARDVGGVIHCFSEDPPFAKAALDLGFVASFSGIVTFKNARAIQEAAKAQPLDAILVETDAPYLAPLPHRGKRNEPAFVAHTAAFIAALRGTTPEAIAETTTQNARRLFGLSP